MRICFDMDGTIADLYGVENWLEMLINEDATPYKIANTLINMNVLARYLNKLQKKGFEIGIISWLAKDGTKQYNEKVINAKKTWLKKHLASVHFNFIEIVEYGTPKNLVANNENDILFDDEEKNRIDWKGKAYNVHNILDILKGLAA